MLNWGESQGRADQEEFHKTMARAHVTKLITEYCSTQVTRVIDPCCCFTRNSSSTCSVFISIDPWATAVARTDPGYSTALYSVIVCVMEASF